MGNCFGDRKEPQNLFDLQDLKNLNETFDYYCDLDEITRKSRQLSERTFEEIFSENPEFGRKLFKLLEIYGKQEKLIKREVLFSILEIFLKDNCLNPELKNFNKLELMSLISLNDTSFIKKEELHALRITYLDAMKIVNDILKIRLADNESYDEIAAKSLLDTIFRNEQLIDWFELIKTLDSEFNQKIIRLYMANKFMRKSMPTLIPQFNTPSYLLNDDQLMLLQMKAKKTVLQTSSKLELLYSNIVHNGGFNQLVKSLLDSKLPSLILLQHEESYIQQSDQSTIRKQYIFGAVSNTRWFDLGVAVGDDNDFIFSIYPRFEVFAAKNDSKRQYQYLNTKDSSKEIGLGFGLGDDNKCRIWLGEDIDDSYCGFEDGTYASGDLVHKHIKKLHINTIEVWGIRQPAQELCETLEPIHVYDIEPVEELNIPDSTANYYWVEEQKHIEEKPDFYWVSEEVKLK